MLQFVQWLMVLALAALAGRLISKVKLPPVGQSVPYTHLTLPNA